jgi:nicotinate-nucleotide adenylyltransferase
MRIGLFGGTFDPVHRCHLRIAEQVRRRLKLDRVVFVPSGDPPHKPGATVQSPRHRLAMVRLAVSGNPAFTVSSLETRRRGRSYAVETVASYRRRYPHSRLFFILGIDAFLEIEQWREAERLLGMCHFVVTSRPGFDFVQLEKLRPLIRVKRSELQALDRGRVRKVESPLQGNNLLLMLKVSPCRASSTQIRERLRMGKPTRNLLPESVKSYILKYRLYQKKKVL